MEDLDVVLVGDTQGTLEQGDRPHSIALGNGERAELEARLGTGERVLGRVGDLHRRLNQPLRGRKVTLHRRDAARLTRHSTYG